MRLGLLLGTLLVLLALEALLPLRKAVASKLRRAAINLALAAVGALVLRAVFFPIVLAVSSDVSARGWGLLGWLGWKGPAAAALAVALLDYTLYLWHVANHRWSFLWRFHGVHHADLDLDVTTASRFHVGELVLSTGYRSAQVLVLGVDPFTLALFETLVTLSAQFHHANIRLPIALERFLFAAIVTPRMHGIHHSLVRRETDSNFSTILNVWDRLHRTLRANVPQAELTIGVPAYRALEAVTLWRSLAVLPLETPAWRLPDGREPDRPELAAPLSTLAA
ncbi:MAG: sterol desaturase family protein [Elusimicrobia bacterium]|nr:sterol desaturase family protein [Elusimicrobiota bacterium]